MAPHVVGNIPENGSDLQLLQDVFSTLGAPAAVHPHANRVIEPSPMTVVT